MGVADGAGWGWGGSNGLGTGTQGPGRALARSPGRRPSLLHARCQAVHPCSQHQSDKETEAHRGAPGDVPGPPAGSWVPCTLGPERTSNHVTVALLSGEWRALPGLGTACWGFRTVLTGDTWAPMPAGRRGVGHAILEPARGPTRSREHKGAIISQDCTANRLCVTRTRRGSLGLRTPRASPCLHLRSILSWGI